LIYELDSKNSIPQKQRFLFPQNRGGIIGDVYIHLKPDFYIAKEKLTTNFPADFKNISLQVESLIKNNKTRASTSDVDSQNEYKLIVSVTDAAGNIIKELPAYNFFLDRNKDITITQKLDLPGVVLWSPAAPSSFILNQKLFKSDSLIDKRQKLVSLFDLKSEKESIQLNGSDYFLKGVTYYPGTETYGKLISYDQMEKMLL